jgi:signal peptidase I
MNLRLIRIVRRAVGLVGIALFCLLAGFSIFTRAAPLLGAQLYIVGGGSMEPAIPTGSLALVAHVDPGAVRLGDVVTIRGESGVVITHRVSRVVDEPEGRFFELKGDANRTPDAGLVPAAAIVGSAGQFIPYAGYAQSYLSTLAGQAAALAILGAFLLAYVLLDMLHGHARATTVPTQEPVGP